MDNICVIERNNKRVQDFYNTNKNVSFELVNEFFVEFMEKTVCKINETQDESINSQLLTLLKQKSSPKQQIYTETIVKPKLSNSNMSSIINNLYQSSEVFYSDSNNIIMRRSDRNDIMFENKDYTHNIPKDEISKFIRDIDVLQMSGIFISQNSGIAFKNNYQIDIHKGNVIVYIQYCNYDPEKIRIAVDIIDNFKDKMNEMNSKDVDNIISKSVLDDINNELQTFISQRDNIIVTMKDFNKKNDIYVTNVKNAFVGKIFGNKVRINRCGL